MKDRETAHIVFLEPCRIEVIEREFIIKHDTITTSLHVMINNRNDGCLFTRFLYQQSSN